jgi:hypothetical protein
VLILPIFIGRRYILLWIHAREIDYEDNFLDKSTYGEM